MENKTLSPAEIEEMVKNGLLRKLHTGSKRGYVSRKSAGIVEMYFGKFGNGYTISTPRFDTTQYVDITYYVK